MYKQLLEIQKKMLSFSKDGKNPHFKSSYLTLDSLLEKLLPTCNDLWVLVYHKTIDWNVVTIVTDWKDNIESSFPIWDTSNPQKVGSCITYAKRYNLGQIFNIMTDEDDDWNKASKKDSSTTTPSNDLLLDRVSQLNNCKTIDEVGALFRQNKPTNQAVLDLFTKRKNELSK